MTIKNNSIESFPYLFSLKNNGTAYITQIKDDGQWLGTHTQSWRSNYVGTAITSFQLNDRPYLFSLKKDDHAYISKLDEYGQGWNDVCCKDWNHKYVAIRSFNFLGHPHLFSLKENGSTYLSRINSDAKGTTKVYEGNWEGSFVGTAITTFEMGIEPYIFSLSNSNKAKITKIIPVSGGLKLIDVFTHDWNHEYVAIRSFQLDGQPYLFALKENDHAYIVRIINDEKGWRFEDYCYEEWSSDYVGTAITTFMLDGHPYIFSLKKNDEAWITRINNDAKGWEDVYHGSWDSDYVAVCSFQSSCSPKTWMSSIKGIDEKKLKNICFPASHDSGTFYLTDGLTPEYQEQKIYKIIKIFEAVIDELKKIPLIGDIIPNPAEWVEEKCVYAVKKVARATYRKYSQQLNSGIRCFDLRIIYSEKEKDFYTYHGLYAVKFKSVLDEIQQFLDSTNGEIVYVTFGHFQECKNRYDEFAKKVKNTLGGHAFCRKENESGNLFDKTYADIVGKEKKSKVILVNGESDDLIFWPKIYSPPDNNSKNKSLAGYYTDTTDVEEMIKTQNEQFLDAKKRNMPFALYFTLTPDEDDDKNIIVHHLLHELKVYLDEKFSSFWDTLIKEAVDRVIEIFENKYEPDFYSLYELSKRINLHVESYLTKKFQTVDASENHITFIYNDFSKHNNAVKMAIKYTNCGVNQ